LCANTNPVPVSVPASRFPSPVVPPKPVPPAKPDLNANGPLAQALAELWEKTRKAKINAVERIVIRFFDATATRKVHQAMATLKDAEINCRFDADIKLEGVNNFQIDFDGRLDKANTVKSFLDPQIRTAADHDFTGTYTVVFSTPLPTTVDRTDAFTRNLLIEEWSPIAALGEESVLRVRLGNELIPDPLAQPSLPRHQAA
jgi:hypothetical protein